MEVPLGFHKGDHQKLQKLKIHLYLHSSKVKGKTEWYLGTSRSGQEKEEAKEGNLDKTSKVTRYEFNVNK